MLLFVAVACVVAATARAVADGRPTAVLAARPTGVEPGVGWRADFALRRHGGPLAHAAPSFWIRSASGAPAFRTREYAVGRYRASVVFPTAGRYRYGVSVSNATLDLGVVNVQPGVRRPLGLAVGPDGALYVADSARTTVVRVDPRTRARTIAARALAQPLYLAFDPGGRLVVADSRNRIYRVERDGSRTLVAGTGARGHTGDGGPATAAALGGSGGIAFDRDGNLVLAEYDGWVRVVRRDGTVGTLAGTGAEGYSGDGGPAARATLRHPHDVAVLSDGSILVADSHNGALRRIGADGVIRSVVSGLTAPVAVAAGPAGSSFVAASGIYRIAADGARTPVATASAPIGVAADGAGNVYFSELEARRVRRVDAATRKVTTLVP